LRIRVYEILGLLGIGETRFIRDIRGTRDSRACRDVRGISNIRDPTLGIACLLELLCF
jgi:hypothetical protein